MAESGRDDERRHILPFLHVGAVLHQDLDYREVAFIARKPEWRCTTGASLFAIRAKGGSGEGYIFYMCFGVFLFCMSAHSFMNYCWDN